jgi:hypothetical protein
MPILLWLVGIPIPLIILIMPARHEDRRRRERGEQPRWNVSMMIMRPPRHGQGCASGLGSAASAQLLFPGRLRAFWRQRRASSTRRRSASPTGQDCASPQARESEVILERGSRQRGGGHAAYRHLKCRRRAARLRSTGVDGLECAVRFEAA